MDIQATYEETPGKIEDTTPEGSAASRKTGTDQVVAIPGEKADDLS